MSVDFTLIFYSLGIPAIYLTLIYAFSKKDVLTISDMFKAIGLGVISTVFTTYSYAAFPVQDWYELDAFEQFFYEVAPREELSKFLAFLILIKFSIKRKLKPVSLMWLCALVGFGFGLEENMIYYYRYGLDVLWDRNFSSLIGHTIFGALMGYWYAIGSAKQSEINVSALSKYQSYFYPVVGILSAVLFHGLWNYNLTISFYAGYPIMIFMIIIGLILIGIYNYILKNTK